MHTTSRYYRNDISTLGWELTVCNALEPVKSPCRRILKHQESYGNLLSSFLEHILPMEKVETVMEIGGGYGCLMRDFLIKYQGMQAIMVDISTFLLDYQRRVLQPSQAAFIHVDFLELDSSILTGIDLALMNENLGDFPVMLNIPKTGTDAGQEGQDAHLEAFDRLRQSYKLEIPEGESSAFNFGAALAVEKLCMSGIPFIFLSEHSCEAKIPQELTGIIQVSAPGFPERIRLKGHDEYTMKFSHLEKIANKLGYEMRRGPVADYLEPIFSERLKAILSGPISLSDDHETIRHFASDLFQYEYLLLEKASNHRKKESDFISLHVP